jgi:hypothetical protein
MLAYLLFGARGGEIRYSTEFYPRSCIWVAGVCADFPSPSNCSICVFIALFIPFLIVVIDYQLVISLHYLLGFL